MMKRWRELATGRRKRNKNLTRQHVTGTADLISAPETRSSAKPVGLDGLRKKSSTLRQPSRSTDEQADGFHRGS